MSDDFDDPRMAKALARYEAVGKYLAMNPKRGEKHKLLVELSHQIIVGPDGEPLRAEPDTIRVWVRRYSEQGLPGLMDKLRESRGMQVLTQEQAELVCRLKQEVPERSLDRIISIAEDMKLVEPDVLKRSTVHRVLQQRGISARKSRVPDSHDLDRFEADYPNDLWQSDMLVGPWLPDPARPGKMRRANLFVFMDDHSRLLLHGRFSFRENLPRLELVFRRALQKWGKPRRVYYDNGQVYRSGHMRQIVAILCIYRIIFTRPRRPVGHGKIEALNRLIRSAFLAELNSSNITTLDALNEAFLAWSDLEYNRKVHSELGQTPLARWRQGVERVEYAEEEALRQAFLWRENRTPDKAGVFSLLSIRYQVSAKLARKRIEVRFDPEALHEVEVWHQRRFVERAWPLDIRAHRRPRAASEQPGATSDDNHAPTADWLDHLVQKRRARGSVEPHPRKLAQQALKRRADADRAVIELLSEQLAPGVLDHDAAKDYLDRHGPFDPDRAALTLERLFARGEQRDRHVTFYLDAIRDADKGDDR